MPTYGGQDSFFKELQARLAAEESIERKEVSAVTRTDNYVFNNNFYRSKLFRDIATSIDPNPSLIEDYKRFLAESYVKVLRLQLDVRRRTSAGTFLHVGKATGKLYQSIKADTEVFVYKELEKGKVHIDYKLTPDYLKPYGDYLANDRSASYIPYAVIMKWMKTKIAQGSFRLLKKLGEKAKSGSKERRMHSIAYAILKKAKSTPREAVLKNWNDYNKNVRLRTMFEKETRKRGVAHRAKIRRSIINNINANYGK